MKKTLQALYRLLQCNETLYAVITATLLGTAAAGGEFGGRLILILAANGLAVGFASAMNAIQDAPDDALLGHGLQQNPVADGVITPQTAKIVSGIAAIFSAILFAFSGTLPFIFGLMTLILGFLSPNRGFRLKNIAFIDLLSHSMLFAGLQFLCGYSTFTQQFHQNWFWPMIFLTAISIYTKLHQEIDLYHHHKAVTFQNTAAVLGERNSQILMFINLIIGVLAGTISFLFINLLPHWSFFVMMGFVLLLMVPTVLKFRRQKEDIAFRNALQRAFEQAAALALLLQYILPWLNQFINHTAI